MTDQRLREATGVLLRRIEELELYRVKDISVQRTVLQTIFGRGSVILQTSDRSTSTVVLRAIADPIGVADMHAPACRALPRRQGRSRVGQSGALRMRPAWNVVTHPIAMTAEPAWSSAAPVLDALLSIGDTIPEPGQRRPATHGAIRGYERDAPAGTHSAQGRRVP